MKAKAAIRELRGKARLMDLSTTLHRTGESPLCEPELSRCDSGPRLWQAAESRDKPASCSRVCNPEAVGAIKHHGRKKRDKSTKASKQAGVGARGAKGNELDRLGEKHVN